MRKYFYILILTLLVVGSAYAFISMESTVFTNSRLPEDETAVIDTVKKVFPVKKYTQNSIEDLNVVLPMDSKTPSNIKTEIEFDYRTGNYIFRTKAGDMEIATPYTMTGEEYRNYSYQQDLQSYWKEKNARGEVNNEDKFSVSDMKFNIGPADKVFGPGGVQVKTQGSAELIFGVKHNRVENPALTEEMRSVLTPNFDMKIQMNIQGSVGDKVNFGMNYNTESSFDFDQKMVKLAYKGKEDDIIKSIQAGNVSMPLSSSLISGSTALFGIKTDLQFGKLSVSAIATQQQSESKTVSSKGGVQKTEFEVKVDEYDENRHFFLSHFFRDSYENAMSNMPYVSSGVTINRVEVWITNKRANYDQARNILAFMDLGETAKIDNPHWTASSGANPHNKANNLYDDVKELPFVRDVQQANAVITAAFDQYGVIGGEDFEKIESARKLDPTEYTVNNTLGIISLKSQLNPDDVLGVAFEYTYRGSVYQVGEFSTDPINDPNISTSPALFVKLLKSTTQLPQRNLWHLMMKNVYSLGAMQIEKDNFELNIVYRNDSVGTDMQYITEGDIKNKLLLRVMNLDRLDVKNNVGSDGKFDFVEGLTANSSSGRIFFPVLEPFGSHLKKMINDPAIAQKYVFQELYDSTLVIAQELSELNKFRIVGEYKSAGGSEIRLNAMNVPRGSVTVTAGGATLVENVDYTVDYTMGTVTILNQSIIESGTNIDVKLENQSTFNMQRKSLLGTHIEYQFNKDFSLGGTIMHLSEQPLTQKVNTGSEPISNTIWGMNTAWRAESQWLTNMLDKLPFVNATKPSTIALNAEFAQLVPGHSKVVGSQGQAYIDDFESTKTSIDIHYPANWYLSSTPQLFSEATSNTIGYGKNRALMAWYYVDQNLNSKNPTRTTPQHLRNNVESQSNHYTRDVQVKEVFPNKDVIITDRNLLTVMNLSFYPTERGPYNLDIENIDSNGNLTNAKARWGGIMRKLDATDFETSNVEYIEFWMMDPFIYDKTDPKAGGELYFNLGDVSEDVLKDGKKGFEHGLPIDGDLTKTDTTIWGRVPKTQSTVTAFDNSPGARTKQDVGMDGLPNGDEISYPTYGDYVAGYKAKLSSEALQKLTDDVFSPINDPAGDNYRFYKSSDYDAEEATILKRYKRFNGTEGNSPDADNSQEDYTTTATSLPNVEDVNGDNTLNEYEKYFQYRVGIKRDSMQIGRNYITDKYTSVVNLENGTSEEVSWYQFKIPIRDGEKVGSIRNFKSIRFVRMFMTGFEKETHLRFATLELVRGEWRKYNKELNLPGKMPITNGALDVQAVNIEENSDKRPVNYVLPPGVTRVIDPGQAQIAKLNEQAMVLKVMNLAPNDARGVYKKTMYDMRQYKRLQLFVHAEKFEGDLTNLNDYDLSCYVRLGSDMTNNYYEYEIPLKLTDGGIYSNESETDRAIVWPEENMFDFPFEVLTNAKLKRNEAKQNGSYTSDYIPFYDKGKNKIRVVGNPSISEVENIMIGIRNNSTKGEIKTGEVWVNEMRLSEFDESGGWAAMGNLAIGLSDLGSINFSGRTETAGFGSIESNVLDRRQEDLYQMNFSTNLDLGRFMPEKAKIQLPAYFSYTNETLTPKYNPLDQDVELADALDNLRNNAQRDTLIMLSQTVSESKSFNIAAAKINLKSKTPQFYDPANLSFNYAYTETNQNSAEVERNLVKQERGGLNYNFSFNPEPVEPFKKIKALSKPVFKLISEFNFNYLPSSISYTTDMNRQFSQVKLRDLSGLSAASNFDLNFSKDFMWNRNFSINYDMTKALRFSLQTATNANIDEGYFTPEIGKEHYEQWRDTVWQSIKKLGNPYAYQQVFTASWNVPINKIPMLDWVTTNATYNSTYSWNRSAPIISGPTETEIGNIATSMGAWSLDGQFNFETLYNKSKYLKEVNRKFSMQQNNQQKFQPKTYNEIVTIEKGKKDTINHRLNSEKVEYMFIGKNGKPVQVAVNQINATSVEISSKFDADSVKITATTLDPNDLPLARKVVDAGVRLIMSARRASITYRQSSNMTLPGFLPKPGFLGQDKSVDGVYAPGYAFTFGLFDTKSINNSTIDNAIGNEWLYQTDSTTNIVNPAVIANTSDLDLKVSLEPIPGLKIDLNAKRYTADNTTIQYMFDGMPSTLNGSYNITQVAIATAFKPIGGANENYDSEVFRTFLTNRQVIVDRLRAKYNGRNYPTTGFFNELTGLPDKFDPSLGDFNENSSDVLIPAFLAAYTGRDISKSNTDLFPNIAAILPNWRMSYDGLSRIRWVKDNFKSISLTHAYTCRYSIGNYTSYSTWVALDGEDNALGYVRDVQSNNPIPSSPYDISSVSLTEQFSPLIGINAALKNSMTAKFEYRKQRNLALNLSSTQMVEANSDEYVIGFGYLLKDFDVILKLKNNEQSKIKNDLKFSADLSYKDIKTLLRKIDENLTQASNGNKMFSLKILADYVFSSKVNIQVFFDRQMTTPLISTTFPVSSTNFGVSFKFMLTR